MTLRLGDRLAPSVQPPLVNAVCHVEVRVARDVHGVERDDGAAHAVEGHVQVDPQRRVAQGHRVHRQRVGRRRIEVRAQLGQEQVRHAARAAGDKRHTRGEETKPLVSSLSAVGAGRAALRAF